MTAAPPTATAATFPRRPRRWPATLVLGLGLILACEALLYVDVRNRGGLVLPLPAGTYLPRPAGALAWAARWVAVNMTALCWIGYLLTFDGLLTLLAWRRPRPRPRIGDRTLSPIRARPNRFLVAWLTSIPVWCYFDWVNFAYLDAWRYWGLPAQFSQRVVGYFIAFAAISPGMFLAAEWYQRLGLARLRTTRGLPIGRGTEVTVLLLGVCFVAWPFWVREPVANLTLWVSIMFLLDPLNLWLGAPSILRDWREGRWGRTLALMAGGATCGLCWEFWNYWALAKWTYHLPFTGRLEQYRYFEMPWIGFQGFLPFAVDCWVALNTFVAILERLHLRVAEPLRDEDGVM